MLWSLEQTSCHVYKHENINIVYLSFNTRFQKIGVWMISERTFMFWMLLWRWKKRLGMIGISWPDKQHDNVVGESINITDVSHQQHQLRDDDNMVMRNWYSLKGGRILPFIIQTHISNNLSLNDKLKYSWAMSGKADIATLTYCSNP